MIKRVIYLSIVLSVLPFFGWTSGNNYPAGARSGSMGNASVTFQTVYSAFHNQAGLAFVENTQFAVSYRNNYLLQETGLKSVAAAVPVKNVGVFALSVNSFGYSNYGEHKFGLAYAHKFGDVLSMALQIDYLQTQFAQPYGSKGVVIGEFGVLGILTENLRVGMHVYNPTAAYLDQETKDRVPTIIKAGLGYEFSKKVFTTIELEKDLEITAPNFKVGVEYKPNSIVALRAGLNSLHSKVSFGMGFTFDELVIDVGSEIHNSLGFMPQMSVRYGLGAKKNKNAISK